MRCGQRASRDGARVGLPGNSGRKPGKTRINKGVNRPVVIRPDPAAQGAAWWAARAGKRVLIKKVLNVQLKVVERETISRATSLGVGVG
jgi:hypothetical protein